MAQNFLQNSAQFVSHLDAEIGRLQELRRHISQGIGVGKNTVKARKGMSAEGRMRVAEAQRLRWAKQKQVAASSGVNPARTKSGMAKASGTQK